MRAAVMVGLAALALAVAALAIAGGETTRGMIEGHKIRGEAGPTHD